MNIADLKQLCAQALLYYTQQLNIVLRKKNIEEFATEYGLLLELKTTLDELSEIQSAENLTAALCEFLRKRDARITFKAQGYTAQPNSTANILCKTIAEAIMKAEGCASNCVNRRLYQLLMPSLNITGVAIPIEDEIYETADLPAYGTFILSQTLRDTKKGPLIDFREVIGLANNLYFFAHMFHSPQTANLLRRKSKVVQLLKHMKVHEASVFNKNEMAILRGFNKQGEIFLQEQDEYLIHIIEGVPLRIHIEALEKGLNLGGAGKGHGGTNREAGLPAKTATVIFFKYYNSLPKQGKEKIRTLVGIGNSATLGTVIDILLNPPPPDESTASCTNANSGILRAILANPANTPMLDSNFKSRTKLNKNKKYEPSGPQLQGKDLMPNYPDDILMNICECWNASYLGKDYSYLINLCNADQMHIIEFLTQKYIEFLKQTSGSAAGQHLATEFQKISGPYQLKVFELIKNHLPKEWEVSDLCNFLSLLSVAQIEEACGHFDKKDCVKITPTVEKYNELFNNLPLDKKNAICLSFKNNWSEIIKSSKDLQLILKERSAMQCRVIFLDIQRENILKNFIKNADDFKLFLQNENCKKIQSVCQIILESLLAENAIKTKNDIKALLDVPNLEPAQGAWICRRIKHILITHVSDHIQFVIFMQRFPVSRQHMIAQGLIEHLHELVSSLESFKQICGFLSKAQRSVLYRNVGLPRLLGMIKTADDLHGVLFVLNEEERTQIYEKHKDKIGSMLNIKEDFYKVLIFLNARARSEVYQAHQSKFTQFFDPALLKLLMPDEVCAIYHDLVKKGWLISQPNPALTFKKILEGLPEEHRNKIYLMTLDKLEQIALTAKNIYDMFIFLPFAQKEELYARLRTQLLDKIKTPHDFIQILEVIPLSKIEDFWQLCRPKFLEIFKTPESLRLFEQRQVRHVNILNKLDDVISKRFIPIYQMLYAAERKFFKINELNDLWFAQTQGVQRMLNLWQYINIVSNHSNRATQALELAMRPLIGQPLIDVMQAQMPNTATRFRLLPSYSREPLIPKYPAEVHEICNRITVA